MPLRNIPEAKLCHFKKGEYLIRQDERIEYLYYLVEGKVHRELLTPDGKEILLNIINTNPDDYIRALVGVLVLHDRFEENNISNCSFIAFTNCTCYRIPVAAYQIFENEHELEITKQLLAYTMDSYQYLFDLYFLKQHKNIGALVCSHILHYAHVENGLLTFDQKVSKITMGKRLDIHPVNISQIINVLVKEGVLQKLDEKNFLITDPDYIRAVANDEIELGYYRNKSTT